MDRGVYTNINLQSVDVLLRWSDYTNQGSELSVANRASHFWKWWLWWRSIVHWLWLWALCAFVQLRKRSWFVLVWGNTTLLDHEQPFPRSLAVCWNRTLKREFDGVLIPFHLATFIALSHMRFSIKDALWKPLIRHFCDIAVYLSCVNFRTEEYMCFTSIPTLFWTCIRDLVLPFDLYEFCQATALARYWYTVQVSHAHKRVGCDTAL